MSRHEGVKMKDSRPWSLDDFAEGQHEFVESDKRNAAGQQLCEACDLPFEDPIHDIWSEFEAPSSRQ